MEEIIVKQWNEMIFYAGCCGCNELLFLEVSYQPSIRHAPTKPKILSSLPPTTMWTLPQENSENLNFQIFLMQMKEVLLQTGGLIYTWAKIHHKTHQKRQTRLQATKQSNY